MRAIRHSLILRQANSRRGISALPETVRPARRIPRFNRPATGTVRFRWRRPPVRAHPQVRRPHPAAALDHRLALPGAFLGLKPVHERSMRYGSAHGASWDDVHRFEGAAMASRPELRCRQLIETLHDEYSELGVTDLRHIGEGMDANVYRAHSAELGSITIKIPHSRWMSTGNEPRLDTRVVLWKEFQLSRYLRTHGVQTPEAFFMHADDFGVDFFVSRFVESDSSKLLDSEFGRLVRAIHDLLAPAVELVASEPSADVDEILTERIERRLKTLASITGLTVCVPDIGSALSACRRDNVPESLLHMDLRPENILVRCGHPVAILDWSNAL